MKKTVFVLLPILSILPASAQLQPSLLTTKDESARYSGSRRIQTILPVTGVDNGPKGPYKLSLDTVPIVNGGTGATDPEQARLNLLGTPKGVLVGNGNGWSNAPCGEENSVLTTTHGQPRWSLSQVGAPALAPYLLNDNTLKSQLPNACVLTAGDGITVAGGSVAVDTTVIRGTKQAGFSQPPIAPAYIIDNNGKKQKIEVHDPAIDRQLIVPDTLGDTAFVMTDGSQNIHDAKILDDLRLTNDSIQTKSGIQTFEQSGTIVNTRSPQVIANKTFQGLTLDNVTDPLIFNKSGSRTYTITAEQPQANRSYRFYDANADCDIGLKSGTLHHGGVVFTDGSVFRSSETGSSSLPLLSGGNGAPYWDVLKASAGGTGITAYAPGDLLVGTANGLIKLPAGQIGQILSILPNGMPGWINK